MNFKELGAELGLEEDEYRELVELFVETGGAEFERLQSALAASDLEQAMRSAHTIKGAAGNLGLMDVQAIAKKIEEGADSRQTEGLTEALQVLAGQMQDIKAFVQP